MEIPLSAIIAVVVSLATAIGVLYRQNIAQQRQVESLLSETKELMGGLAELIRACNTLMVEVKNVMQACQVNNDDQ